MRMKKILLINGSPKGKASNTRKLAMSFLKGLNEKNEYEIEEIVCAKLAVNDCKGCFYCWKNEEGKCAISDDMTSVFKNYLAADIVIWSFPNYFYGMPSCVKRVMDRLLPLFVQNLNSDDGETTYHPCRFDLKNKKYILFCTCGLYNTKCNTEAIESQFKLLYEDKCDMLFCSEGQLLSNQFLDYCTIEYLNELEKEGAKYRECFRFSSEIKKKFATPFLNIKEFLEFVDSSSVIKTTDKTEEEYIHDRLKSFFKSMSLTYDASRLSVDKSVLEIQITDYPFKCQLHMNKQNCVLVTNPEHFVQYRLKVIANLYFFEGNPSLTGEKHNKRIKGPDFNMLIDLINKFETKGITKELKFC